MKQLIVFIVLFLLSIRLIAQDVSIELSIEWKKELDFSFKKFQNKDIQPAYLNITYRNISDRPLCFLKISEGVFDLPEIAFISHHDYQDENFPYYDYGYCKYNYIIGFKNVPYYSMSFSWDIRSDTASFAYKMYKTPKHAPLYYDVGCQTGIIPVDTINDGIYMTLDNIYNFIYRHYYPEIQEKIGKDGKEQWYHYSTDITQDTIMNNSIDKFVFLKPGETYVDKYNLIGFQITGGTFTFQLDDTKSLDYVETEPVYKDENQIFVDHYLKKQLPLKVGEYELFTGEFLTNKVSVQFPGIRLKE